MGKIAIVLVTGQGGIIGPVGPIYVAIQCGCGWTVVVSSPDGKEAHHDLYDAAESRLSEHLKTDETPACRPWIA